MACRVRLSIIPLSLTFFVFSCSWPKDSPNQPPPKSLLAYGQVLAKRDAWWFCFFYSITFGGFVGLASFLNTFFKDQYFAADPKSGAIYAGYFATACVIAGSFLRPVGGYLADRIGGIRLLLLLYIAAGFTLFGVATLPPVWFRGGTIGGHDGAIGNGEWCGISGGATAISEGNWGDDGTGRCGGRDRRILSAEFVGVAEKGDRQLRFGTLGLCGGRTDRGHCAADRGLDLGEETGSGTDRYAGARTGDGGNDGVREFERETTTARGCF